MSNKVTKRLGKADVLTIPNALSFLRVLLIPIIFIVYLRLEEPWNRYVALGVALFSALTDIVDGWIARTFDMISDFGKFLDPVADKLTQAALVICLILRGSWQAMVLLALFAAKEIVMFWVGSVVLKRTDTINSAQWFGKVTTVVLYAGMLALLVFELPFVWATVILSVCGGMMLFSMVRYLVFYYRLLKQHPKEKNAKDTTK